MRGGVVAAGVVLMLVGAVLVFAQPGTGLTSLGGSSGSNIATNTLMGLAFGFIGFIVLIAGLAASPNTPPTVIQYAAPAPNYTSSPRRSSSSSYDDPEPSEPPQRAPPRSRPASSTALPPVDPTPMPAPKSEPASSVDGEGRFCPYCGKATMPGYKFCRSCGHTLDE